MLRIWRNRVLAVCIALSLCLWGCVKNDAVDSVVGSWTYTSTAGSVTYNWTFSFAANESWTLSGSITGAADGTENLLGSGTYILDTAAKTIVLNGSTTLTHGTNPNTYDWLLGTYS
jgi:hypothetical protein